MSNQTTHPEPGGQDFDAVTEPPVITAPLDPQVAAELAQELTLVTRALFAQLLPATAHNAVAGIPGLGSHSPAATVAAAEQAPLPNQVAPAEGGAVPEPAATPAPVTLPPPPAPAPAPAAALPVPSLPITRPDASADDVPPAEFPRPVRRRSTAVLDEIAFLDE